MASRGFFPHRNYQPRAQNLSAHMMAHAHITEIGGPYRTEPHRTAPHRTTRRTRAYQESTKSEPRAHQECTRSVPYRTYINFFLTGTVCPTHIMPNPCMLLRGLLAPHLSYALYNVQYTVYMYIFVHVHVACHPSTADDTW